MVSQNETAAVRRSSSVVKSFSILLRWEAGSSSTPKVNDSPHSVSQSTSLSSFKTFLTVRAAGAGQGRWRVRVREVIMIRSKPAVLIYQPP